MPALAPRLLNAGVCFGFADPVTNIIANTLFILPDEDGEPASAEPGANCTKKRKRNRKTKASGEARDEVISKIVAGNAPSPPKARTIAERSLEGLVTFLTSYFRYLHSWDALRYLCLAKADLLVTVRLIEIDRCYRHNDKFCIRSYAVKTALKYAALSASQPSVDEFCTFSFALVSRVSLITQIVQADRSSCLSIKEIHSLSRLLKNKPKLKKTGNPMAIAAQRFDYSHNHNNASTEKVPGGLTISLRAVLLDRIHAQYLRTVSRLPMQDIRNRHHRGLLKAGYCYGPFSPATNIIVNTIWYDTAFPAPEEFEVDMICSPIFMRVESRSLDGLIKLLLTCIPEISEHEAMVYLLKNNLKVRKAIRMARTEGCDPSSWDVSAYMAPMDASVHPEPEAYMEFATQFLPSVRSAVKTLLHHSNILSSSEVSQLSVLFSASNSNPAKPLEAIVELSKDALEIFSPFKETFSSQQIFLRRKIEATLSNKGYSYELRVICGANERVGKQESFVNFKCPYSHVNFLASSTDGTALELFFAEFSNDEDEKSFCCIVSNQSIHHVRCCYCEYEGARIVHPVDNFCGGDTDFAKIACRDHYINNARIISGGKLANSRVNMRGEDYIYFDPTRDTKFIECMNRSALRANENWSDCAKIAETYVF